MTISARASRALQLHRLLPPHLIALLRPQASTWLILLSKRVPPAYVMRLALAAETGKSREDILEAAVDVLFGIHDEGSDYLAWTPLNQRSDLNPQNFKSQSFSDPVDGYSILYPEKWDMDVGSSPTIFLLAPYATDGIRPDIAITPNKAPISFDLDIYASSFLSKLKSVKTDITGDVVSKQTTFQNQPAYEIAYDRLRTFDGGRTYIKQTDRSILFFRNNIAYLVEYRNGVGDFQNTEALADTIINSLEFSVPCTGICTSRH
ncbi:MAG: hypothetical protein KGI69_02770 [Patescibacteria group bacterium]|nr:hypothetical protein [Patescibacteria group bacterium]